MHLLDYLDLSIEASRPAFYERHVGCQTHLIHMPSRVEIVQGVEDQVEALEPLYVELGIFDVCVMRFKSDVRVEFGGGLFGNLAS